MQYKDFKLHTSITSVSVLLVHIVVSVTACSAKPVVTENSIPIQQSHDRIQQAYNNITETEFPVIDLMEMEERINRLKDVPDDAMRLLDENISEQEISSYLATWQKLIADISDLGSLVTEISTTYQSQLNALVHFRDDCKIAAQKAREKLGTEYQEIYQQTISRCNANLSKREELVRVYLGDMNTLTGLAVKAIQSPNELSNKERLIEGLRAIHGRIAFFEADKPARLQSAVPIAPVIPKRINAPNDAMVFLDNKPYSNEEIDLYIKGWWEFVAETSGLETMVAQISMAYADQLKTWERLKSDCQTKSQAAYEMRDTQFADLHQRPVRLCQMRVSNYKELVRVYLDDMNRLTELAVKAVQTPKEPSHRENLRANIKGIQERIPLYW